MDTKRVCIQDSSDIDLVDLIYRLFDKIIYIVLAGVAGALIFSHFGSNETITSYTATSKVYLLDSSNSEQNLDIQTFNIVNSMVNDYVAAFSNMELHQRVVDELGLTYSAEQLASLVSISNEPETHILDITVITATSAEETQLVANVYAEIYCRFLNEKFCLETASVFEKASLPASIKEDSSGQNRMLGTFAGVVIACAIVIFGVIFDDRIRIPDDINRCMDIPILGVLTDQKKSMWEKMWCNIYRHILCFSGRRERR